MIKDKDLLDDLESVGIDVSGLVEGEVY